MLREEQVSYNIYILLTKFSISQNLNQYLKLQKAGNNAHSVYSNDSGQSAANSLHRNGED